MPILRVSARIGLITSVLLIAAPLKVAAQELTLAETERLALEHAPWYAHHRANVDAAAERAVYEGRLPDPQLTLGYVNVPTDTWKLDQEDMTMTMVGVRQSFPPYGALDARTRRAERTVARERARLETERANLMRQVRGVWYELYYATQGQILLAATRALAVRDLEAAEGRFRAAQDSPRAVLRARQTVARIDERTPMLHAAAERARASLARWIPEHARDPLPDALPALPAPPPSFDAARHPETRAAQAELEAMQAEVDMARAEYRPGVMLDLNYGRRRPMPDGAERPNTATVMVTLDLPIFRSKRQDRRLAESQNKEVGARLETEDKRRELEAMYGAMRAEFEALDARVRVFEERLVPSLKRETEVTLVGFAREQVELRDARMRQLDAELELLRLRVDRSKTQAELLYLTGEEP